MADSLRFVLDFAAKTAGLKDAAALADLLGDELDDTTDAGKAMAAALAAAAAKAEKDLADTVEMADKLGAALGPELSGKVNLDQIAADMRAVGMTTEQVDANIDSFRASLTSMAQTADQVDARMGSLDTSVRRVGDTTDRSRSVMANFTGNAMQEIPGLTGAFGPLNMAIGQFAEYAAEGGISWKGFAKGAAAMGAIALVMSQIGKNAAYAEKHAASLESALDNIKSKKFAEAAEDLVSAYEQFYKQGPEIGATAQDITDAILGNEDAYNRVIAAVTNYRDAQEQGSAQWIGADALLTQYTERLKGARGEFAAAATDSSTMGEATDEVARALSRSSLATDDVTTASDRLARKLRETGNAWDDFVGRFDKDDTLANAVLELEGLDEKLADIRERLGKGEITDREAWAESVLAINSAKDAAFGLLEEFGNLSPVLAQEIEVLINTGRIDEAIQKMVELRRLTDVGKALGDKAWGMVSGLFGGGGGSPAPATPAGSGAHASAPPNITVNVSALNATAETGRLVADSLAAHYRTGGQRP